MHRALIAVAALLALLPARNAHGGAWTRDPGGWFLKLGYDRWHTEQRYDADGRRVPFEAPESGFVDPSGYRSDVLRAYAEYGLAEGLTGSASASYERVETEGRNLVRRSAGPGDLALALRRRLLAAPFPVSAEWHAQLPLGDASGEGPALGAGHADFGARLLLGFSTARFYATGGAGYTVRGGTRADELPWSVEAGHRLGPASLRLELRGAMTKGVEATDAGPFDPALAQSSHLTGGAGLVLHGRPLDFVLTAEHVLDGTRTLAGTRFTFSIWAQR